MTSDPVPPEPIPSGDDPHDGVTGIESADTDWPDDSTPDTSSGRRSRTGPLRAAPQSMDELRDTYREQMLANIGGWSGALITAIPTSVFVIVNIAASLRVAVGAAIGSALVLAAYRFVRKQPVQQALSGLFGVLIAAVIAARTGEARGFFLLGIITSFLYSLPFGISVLVRRPLVGLLWEFLDPTPGVGAPDTREADTRTTVTSAVGASADPPKWYRIRPLLIAYTWATVAATLVFLLRGVVQLILYRRNDTGWLAIARIAMGYPLFVAAIGFGLLVVRGARKKVAADRTSPGPDAIGRAD